MFEVYSMKTCDSLVKDEFVENKFWGIECLVNLKGCNLEKIKDGELIKQFIKDLCVVIDMEMYGDTILERFGSGHLYGYSAMQLIRTSSITMHLAEEDGRVFLDIFSCKEFAPNVAAKFAAEYFEASGYEFVTIMRD